MHHRFGEWEKILELKVAEIPLLTCAEEYREIKNVLEQK
jgi:hypothetical protein